MRTVKLAFALPFLLAAATPATAAGLEIEQGFGLHQLDETFAAGGVDAHVHMVGAYQVTLRRPTLYGNWTGQASFEWLAPYAFVDQALPSSQHLRGERRAALAAVYPFAWTAFDQELTLGFWGRTVDTLSSFAPPATSFLFSASQTYLAPNLGYHISHDLPANLTAAAGLTAQPAVFCLLDRGVTGPGWLWGAGAEASLRYGRPPYALTAAIAAQTLRTAATPFWLDWSPTLTGTVKF